MKNLILILIFSLCTLLPASEEARKQLLAAQAAEAANAAATAEKHEIRVEKYRHAIALYRQLEENFQMKNGALYYNLGNAHAAIGEYPKAILNYRRAQLYIPNDMELQENLKQARTMCKDHFKADESTRVLKTLLFWHYDTSFAIRLMCAAFLGIIFWCAAATLLWYRPKWLKYTAAALLLLASSAALSAAATAMTIRKSHPAVIMVDEALPRKGAAQSYAPAFDKPLHAGAEVNVIQEQGEWVEIQIPGNLTGWLHQNTLEKL